MTAYVITPNGTSAILFKRDNGEGYMFSFNLPGGTMAEGDVARALDGDPSLILAFQHTRGLDIDGTAQVYAALRAACLKGASAFVVCFDLDELLANCDRVVAISHGQILSPRPGEEKDRQAIGRLMVGAA